MKKPLFIFGAGGLGREVRAMIGDLQEWEVAGFFDDHKPEGTRVDGVLCKGGVEKLISDPEPKSVVLALGSPAGKMAIINKLSHAKHINYPVLVHPSVILLDPARIKFADGCVIAAGCILTTGISLGKHTLLNLNVTVGHDTTIGMACSVMPGANLAGNVTLGDAVLVGSGANIINHLHIGSTSIIGAGAAVIRDVPAATTVVGVPAKPI